MKLEIGMIITTNYSGPYRIVDIVRGCTCPFYLDEIDMADPPPTPPHVHLTLTDVEGNTRWLGHFDESSLRSLRKTYCGFKDHLDFDYIFILPHDRPIQVSLF